jgi:hypothetical protein
MFHRPTLVAILSLLAIVATPSTSLGAAPQPPADAPLVSLERVREELTKPPAPKLLDTPLQLPVTTFKSSVEQRVFVLSFEERLHKDLELGILQRQSADWASKCCGIDVNRLFKGVTSAMKRREVRKIRERIARELAALEAAREK